MRRNVIASVLAATIGVSLLSAQNETAPERPAPGGPQLKSVAVFMTYYSVAPQGTFVPTGTPLTNVTGIGGTASLGYSKYGQRTGLTINYVPTYISSLNSSTGRISDHALSLSFRRNLTPKLTYSFAIAGTTTSVSNALFMPTSTANVVAAPATSDQFATALVNGKLGNDPLGTTLTGTNTLESPAGLLLYGSRFLSASAQMGVSYARSSRVQIYMNINSNRTQPLKDSNTQTGFSSAYMVAHTTSSTGTLGIGYSFSPRTQLGVEVASTRTISTDRDAYITSTGASIAHTMGMHWFVQAHAGAGFINTTRQLYPLRTGVQSQGGGSVGYKMRAQTLLASVDRSVSDAYGYGAFASITATGAWNWNPVGRAWSCTANFVQQWLAGNANVISQGTINSWRATAGLTRKLNKHMAVTSEYAYLSDYRFLGGPGTSGGQHMARVALVFIPNARTMQ